jgi:hypothetical protein
MITEVERWNYLRNDIYHIWTDSPGLTTSEPISLMRKRGLIERPQIGIMNALDSMRIDFDARTTRPKDAIDKLDKEDTPLGSNPFMH